MLRKIQKLLLVAFSATGLVRVIEPITGGKGAILMLHRVRARPNRAFQPNEHLEITPKFLSTVLSYVKKQGMDFIPLDDMPSRLANPSPRRFVAITLDDASLDNLTDALPVFKAHNCPFTIYTTSGFADRTALPWWMVLEEILLKQPIVDAHSIGGRSAEVVGTTRQKYSVFERLVLRFVALPEDEKQSRISTFAAEHGFDTSALMERNFMNWDHLREIAACPLATIGGHTTSHPMLSRLSEEDADAEVINGARRIEQELGVYPKHFAYPYGKSVAASRAAFKIIERLGFETAVTTRGGILHGAGRERIHALPRLSLNGHYQDTRVLSSLLSGAPYLASSVSKNENLTFAEAEPA